MNRRFLILLALWVNACVDHPATDPRTFYCEVLDNGLTVLLIEDPQAQEAAAAMRVGVGSQNDPEGREGLAHFLEHMLFIATERYSEVDALNDFVSTRGGQYNAMTGREFTQYFFSVKPEFFEKGLDIFSAFFVNPLFPEEYVERERHAVHSEYLMNKENDQWRIHYVNSLTRGKHHPVNRFHVGDLNTLGMRSLRDDLVDFYEAHYSADNMHFVAVVPKDAESYMEIIKTQLLKVPKRFWASGVSGSVFGDEGVGRWMTYKPVEDHHALLISFPIESQREQYLSPATAYLARLVGDEGPGSIIDVLRQAGLANSLYAAAQDVSEEDGEFMIYIELTEEGLAQQDTVMATVNAYIKMMASQGIQLFRFQEMQRSSYLNYLYYNQQSAISQVNQMVRRMPYYPQKQLYRAGFILEDSVFDRRHIHTILNKMVLSNARVMLISPSVETDQTEPIYDTEYSNQPISEQQYRAWQQKVPFELSLPKKNPYIADGVNLVVDETFAEPQQAGLDWYFPTKHFAQPKQFVSVAMSLPMNTVEDAASAALLQAVLSEESMSQLYPAVLAGSSINVSQDQYGLVLHVGGMGDKQILVAERMEALLASLTSITDDQYRRVKQQLLLEVNNAKHDRPFRYLIDKLKGVFTKDGYLEEEKEDALQRQTVVGFRRYVESALADMQVRRLYSGNIVFDEKAETVLLGNCDHTLQLEGKTALNFVLPQDEYAAVVYYQMPDKTYKDYIMSAVLSAMIRPEVFKQLRTVEQIGYIVSASAIDLDSWPGMVVFAQSPSVDAEGIQKRIETFLSEEYHLEKESFEGVKQGLLVDLRKPFQTMAEEHEFYWKQIYTGKFDYQRKAALADVLENLSFEDVETYFQDYLQNPRQLSLLANGEGEETMRAYNDLRMTEH